MNDDGYDYQQHNFCMAIYLDEEGFHISTYKTGTQNKGRVALCFDSGYDKNWPSVLNDTEFHCVITKLSEDNYGKHNNEAICENNFLRQLLHLYSKNDGNDEEKVILKSVGKALELFVKEAQKYIMEDSSEATVKFNCHYLFILHFDCIQADFEEKIVRPLFTQANLITSNDHPNKLHVFTELDYFVNMWRTNEGNYCFTNSSKFNAARDVKKKERYLISMLEITNEDELSWSCQPFEFVASAKFGSQNGTSFQSTLVPRAIRGLPSATERKFNMGTRVFSSLSDLLKSKQHNLKHGSPPPKKLIISSSGLLQNIPNKMRKEDVNNIMSLIIDYFYDEKILDRYIWNNDNDNNSYKVKLDIQLLDYYNNAPTKSFRTTQRVSLNVEQQTLIKGISTLEIYSKLLAPIQHDIKEHLEFFTSSRVGFVNNLSKLYVVSELRGPPLRPKYSWYTWFESWVHRWITRTLAHYENSTNYRLALPIGRRSIRRFHGEGDNSQADGSTSNKFRKQLCSNSFNRTKLLAFAWEQLIDKVRNANLVVPPYFLNSQQQDTVYLEETISSATTDKREEQYSDSRLERLQSTLQDKFNVNLKLKSYYLQVHLYKERIQLALYQSVKVMSNDEDATVFVVEDRAISIENVHDSFCKRILNCGGLFDDVLCNIHNQQVECDNNDNNQKPLSTKNTLHTKQDYKKASINLKKYFDEVIRSTDGLDLDVKRMVKLNDTCRCRLNLSMRDFIEIALIPTIKEIAVAVSVVLVNKEYFGRYYNTNHVFVLLGDLLLEHKDGVSSSAFMMKMLAKVVEEVLQDSNHEKEIQPNCFFCTDTIESLYIQAQQRHERNKSKPSFGSSPHNDTAFRIKRTFHPVSKETYGFGLVYGEEAESEPRRRLDLYQQIDGTTDKLTLATDTMRSPIIIVEKGKPVPIEGIHKAFYYKYHDESFAYPLADRSIQIYKMHHKPHLQNQPSVADCSHSLGGSSDSELIFNYDFCAESGNHIGNRFSSSTKDMLMPIHLSITYDHPDSLLNIMINYADVHLYPHLVSVNAKIGQPLTLAYDQTYNSNLGATGCNDACHCESTKTEQSTTNTV